MAKIRSSMVTYNAGCLDASDSTQDRVRAKVFANGRSQAVRLPKSMRFTCNEVFIRQKGETLILEPIPDVARDARGWRIGMWKEMATLREGLDLDEFSIETDPVPEPVRRLDAR